MFKSQQIEQRLKTVLIGDRSVNTGGMKSMLESDLYVLLTQYMSVDLFELDIEINEDNSYEVKLKVTSPHFYDVGKTLSD